MIQIGQYKCPRTVLTTPRDSNDHAHDALLDCSWWLPQPACLIWWPFCRPCRASGPLQSSCISCWRGCIITSFPKPFWYLLCTWFVCRKFIPDSNIQPYLSDPGWHSLVASQNIRTKLRQQHLQQPEFKKSKKIN